VKAAVAGSLGRSLTHLLTVTDDQPTNQELTHFAPVSQSACCSNCETAFGRSVGRCHRCPSVSRWSHHSLANTSCTNTYFSRALLCVPSFLPSFFLLSFLPSFAPSLSFVLASLSYLLLACLLRARCAVLVVVVGCWCWCWW